jgi:very-short-patch-repair endonuclease
VSTLDKTEKKKEYDMHRDKVLVSYGLKVIHYNDIKVLSNFELIEKDFKEEVRLCEQELKLK